MWEQAFFFFRGNEMANRNFKPGAMAIEKGLICLYGRVVVGASGAITSQDTRGFEVSLSASPGVYDVTLEDGYNDLRMVTTNVIGAVAVGEGKMAQVTTDLSAKVFEITFYATDDGAAADVGSGKTFLIEITLKNSTVTY